MESIKNRAPQRRQRIGRIGLRARKKDLRLNVHRLEARARGAFWYGREDFRWPAGRIQQQCARFLMLSKMPAGSRPAREAQKR
jgi:hypothetical protein